MKLGGVVIPLVTPLSDAGELDRGAQRRLIEFLLDAGVDGLFANGSMGGFALLPDRVQQESIASAAEIGAGRKPFLAGVSDTSTRRTLDRIRALSGVPVDFFVALPPYFYLAGVEELRRFYLTLADAAPRPLVIYDNPRLTKLALPVKLVADLAAHPNIAGIKVSHTDVFWWQELLRAPLDRRRFAIISGAGKLHSLALQLGFDGITEGLHNLTPHLAVELYQAACRGDDARAGAVQERINRCFRVFELDGGWRGAEAALEHLGIGGRVALPPYDLPLSDAHRREIIDLLAAATLPPQ